MEPSIAGAVLGEVLLATGFLLCILRQKNSLPSHNTDTQQGK